MASKTNWTRTILVLAVIAVLGGTAVCGALVCKNTTPSKAPDYSKSENWLYAETNGTHEVDLFYLYPTCAKHSDYPDGSSDIDDQMREDAADVFLTTGKAFAGYTNVFAPMYRQKTLSADDYSDPSDYDEVNSSFTSSLGFKDVTNALEYYLKHFNNGKPFIIAGHSQGSCMILGLLEGYLKYHPVEYSRMIAAYAIGDGVSQSWLDENPHIKFATGAKDTGVLISWNTEGPATSGGYKGNFLIPDDCVLINPITWTRSTDYAPKELNKGEYVDPDTTLPGQNDAQINAERGSVTCTTITDYLNMPELFGDVSLHGYDYKAYFKDITVNGYDRVCAFLGHKPANVTSIDCSDEECSIRFGLSVPDVEPTVDFAGDCWTAETLVATVKE